MTTNNHGLNPTRQLPYPNKYVTALLGEYSTWAYCEETSPKFKGEWRQKSFNVDVATPLDIEIGTGNGYHFANYAQSNPGRLLVGFEIKYKPLIQSIRRTLKQGAENARICRYDAGRIDHIFAESEVNNIIIHHPDPWPKKREWKRRLIQDDFLKKIYKLQKINGVLEFKTDDKDYFDWSLKRFKTSDYEIVGVTYDLHNSEFSKNNFVTTFEKIFLDRGQSIYFAKMIKN